MRPCYARQKFLNRVADSTATPKLWKRSIAFATAITAWRTPSKYKDYADTREALRRSSLLQRPTNETLECVSEASRQ